jgi:hypothetical protein
MLVSVVGWLAAAYALFLLTWGMFLLNNDYFDAPASLTWPIMAMPLVCGFGAASFLGGWNWGRYLYWLLAVGLVVALFAMHLPFRVWRFGMLLPVLGALVAGPGAHWYFTGRDFRRRPGYRAYFDQQKREAHSRKFEY